MLNRRIRALRWIVLSEKLRERVMEARAYETLLLHLGTIEAERRDGAAELARYPPWRRKHPLGIARLPEAIKAMRARGPH